MRTISEADSREHDDLLDVSKEGRHQVWQEVSVSEIRNSGGISDFGRRELRKTQVGTCRVEEPSWDIYRGLCDKLVIQKAGALKRGLAQKYRAASHQWVGGSWTHGDA